MRRWLSICVLLICIGATFDAVAQPFVVYDTIPVRHRTSRLRLYKCVEKWLEKEKGQKLIGKNWKELKFKGKGYFPYANYVQMPDVYLSSHAAEKTKGSIVFSISVEIQDSIIVTKFSNFIHEARFTEYGSTSFGRLMSYDKVPAGKCMEVEEWCNAVWADMKAWSLYETKTRAKRMIPSTLIRKRTFKVQEDTVKAPPTVKPFDNAEYLKIENYLLKDTEGKYADYNKDPEEIEAEKAAAAAALAEKEKKKHKDEEVVEEELDEYEESTDSEAKEDVVEDAPVVEEKQVDADSDDYYDDDEGYDDEEVKPSKGKAKKEKAAKSEKSEKQSKSKPAKEKKSKKSDDYDDYDDDYEDDDYE